MTRRQPRLGYSSPETVIVGAGLAGLAAAGSLSQAGREVLLVEASDVVGGRVRTDQKDGFLLDRGFQVLLTAYPELGRHLDIEALELQTFGPGAMVFHSGRLRPITDPFRAPKLIASTTLSRAVGIRDKLALLQLRRHLRGRTGPDIANGPDAKAQDLLGRMGFTPIGWSRFLSPLLGGIQLNPTVDGSGRLALLVLKMLFEGNAALPSKGMGEVPAQMAARLQRESVLLSSPVDYLAGREVRTTCGKRFTPMNVVIATEGPEAARLLGLKPVRSRTATCVYFAAPHPPTDSTRILLDGEGLGPALNVAVTTNVSPSYSSGDEALVVTVVPGSTNPEIAVEIQGQMRRWFGDEVDGWRHVATYPIDHCQPDLRVGDPFRRSVDLGAGLFVCGDHRDTPSIQGALVSGRRTAEALLGKSRP